MPCARGCAASSHQNLFISNPPGCQLPEFWCQIKASPGLTASYLLTPLLCTFLFFSQPLFCRCSPLLVQIRIARPKRTLTSLASRLLFHLLTVQGLSKRRAACLESLTARPSLHITSSRSLSSEMKGREGGREKKKFIHCSEFWHSKIPLRRALEQ